jgi:hypothetical protein
MATEIRVRKLYNSIVPIDAANAELFEKLKPNGQYKAVFSQERNSAFHRKAFALLKVVFDAWQTPTIEHKGQPVQRDMERLREDMTILAGFYTVTFKYDGTTVLKAKSWSFSAMNQDDFENLYSRLIDVALGKILTGYTREDIDEQVERILRFA